MAFGSEESGLEGSIHYAASPPPATTMAALSEILDGVVVGLANTGAYLVAAREDGLRAGAGRRLTPSALIT